MLARLGHTNLVPPVTRAYFEGICKVLGRPGRGNICANNFLFSKLGLNMYSVSIKGGTR